MKKIRIASIVMVLSFLLSPILGSWPTQKVSAAVTSLTVNTGSVIQPNFLGLGGVYHGFSYMPESNLQGMTDTLRAIDFDRVNRAKLSIARSWYGSDWAMPTWGGAYTWNSTKMTALYTWLQAMKDRGVDVALNMGWWFTEGMCSSNMPTTCTPNETTDVDTYTKWVSDSLKEMITVRGFTNIKYIIAFTEPGDYCGCGNLPAGYTQMTYYNLVINALHTRLVNDGTRSLTKIVGPNSSGMNAGQGRLWIQNAVTNLNSAIDIYSSHDYSLPGYDEWYNMVTNGINDIAATGKPFWLDEYGKQDEVYRNTSDYGVYLAEINAASINAKAQHTSIWLYEDQYYVTPLQNLTNTDSFYNGLHKWGTQNWLPTSTAVRPAWYAFTMMSRFLGGAGSQVYDTTKSLNGIRISATKQADGNWSVLVVNSNTTSQDITVNFTAAINKTLWKHLYNPNNVPTGDGIIGSSAQYTNVTTSFNDTLPARGVAIYTSIDDGTASAPYSLTAVPEDGQTSLSWSAPLSGATSYNIKWSTNFGGPYTTIQTGVTTTSYINTGLTNGTMYYYVVTAVNGAESGNSNQAFATPNIIIQNIATGAVVTATSSYEADGWGTVKANDGQLNSVIGSYGWTSNSNLTVNHTESITLNMGLSKTVAKVDLYPRNDAGNIGENFPIDFTIKTSSDGITYTTVVTRTGYAQPSNAVQTFSFPAVSAQYVRVEGTNLRPNPNDANRYRMAFAEVEIYNGVGVAPGVVDQNNSVGTFASFSDIGSVYQRLQTFTITGTAIPKIGIWTYKNGSPSDNLVVNVYAIDATNNPIGSALATVNVNASSIPTTEGWMTVNTNLVGLTSGGKYGFKLSSPASGKNAYGFGYNDSNLYSQGVERYSSNGGSSWSTEVNRSLKFITYK